MGSGLTRREFLKLSGAVLAFAVLPQPFGLQLPASGIEKQPPFSLNDPPPLFQAKIFKSDDIYGVSDSGPVKIGVLDSHGWLGVYGWAEVTVDGQKQEMILNSPWGQWVPRTAVRVFGSEHLGSEDIPPSWVGRVVSVNDIYEAGKGGLRTIGVVKPQGPDETIAVYGQVEIFGRKYYMTSCYGQYVSADAIGDVRWYDPEIRGFPFLINGIEFRFDPVFSLHDKQRIVMEILNPATAILIKTFASDRFIDNLHRREGLYLNGEGGYFGFSHPPEVDRPTIVIPKGWHPSSVEKMTEAGGAGAFIPLDSLFAKFLHELVHASYLFPSWSAGAEEGFAYYCELGLRQRVTFGDRSGFHASVPKYMEEYDTRNSPSLREETFQDCLLPYGSFRLLAGIAFYKIEERFPGILRYLTGLDIRPGYNEISFGAVAEKLKALPNGEEIIEEIQSHHVLFTK